MQMTCLPDSFLQMTSKESKKTKNSVPFIDIVVMRNNEPKPSTEISKKVCRRCRLSYIRPRSLKFKARFSSELILDV